MVGLVPVSVVTGRYTPVAFLGVLMIESLAFDGEGASAARSAPFHPEPIVCRLGRRLRQSLESCLIDVTWVTDVLSGRLASLVCVRPGEAKD